MKSNLLLNCRGILALNVFLWHLPLSSKYVLPGRISVIIFFGISAYSILSSLNFTDLNLFNIIVYLKKRFYRIYPVFLFSSFLMVFIFPENVNLLSNIGILFSQFLFMQYNHDYKLNGVFWTLGIEVQFYFLAPVLILIYRRCINIKLFYHFVFYFLLFLIPILYAFLEMNFTLIDSRNLFGNLSHFYISFIAIGLLPFLNKINIKPILVFGLIFIILLITTFIYHKFQLLFWTFGSLLIDLIIIFLIYLDNLELHFFSKSSYLVNKLLEFIGKISFGIYAYHEIAIKFFGNNLIYISIITFLLSYFSYKFYEPLFIRKSKLLIYK